jgi:hypothetical protein
MIHIDSMFSVPRSLGLPRQKAVPWAGAEPNGSHMIAQSFKVVWYVPTEVCNRVVDDQCVAYRAESRRHRPDIRAAYFSPQLHKRTVAPPRCRYVSTSKTLSTWRTYLLFHSASATRGFKRCRHIVYGQSALKTCPKGLQLAVFVRTYRRS